MISPHSNEKIDLLNIVNAKYPRELDQPQTEALSKFLRRFLSAELVPFDAAQVENVVRGFEPFREDVTEHSSIHMQEFLR